MLRNKIRITEDRSKMEPQTTLKWEIIIESLNKKL